MSDDEDNFQLYGTLLEPYEEDEVPTKKAFSIEDQIATDDQGRRRFHGAFTGGFSAGFFNTVGSLEGWKPSEFKSSRAEKAERKSQKPQDFMDDEDIGQFGIAPSVVRATSDYSNVVRNKRQMKLDGPIPGVPVLESILEPARETVGIMLLKKMGWKQGQGIGPRISKTEKRKINRENNSGKVYGCEIPEEFRKDGNTDDESSDDDIDITFAPDDYDSFVYKPKDNTFGMGYTGLDKRPILSSHINLFGPSEFKMRDHKNNKISISGQAFGVGAFEHEDEDIYAGEDMTKYDFELDSKRKTKKKIQEKPNKEIIEGFVSAKNPVVIKKSFPGPNLPKNFIPKHGVRISRFEPLPENHKMHNYKKTTGRHDLTSEQRSKILNISSEIIPVANKPKDVFSRILDNSVENEALKAKAAKITNSLPSTSIGPFKPFQTNPPKQQRYEQYLTLTKLNQQDKFADVQPASMSEQEKDHEKYEFAQASRMFKPVTGLVFDKFVAASSSEDSTNPLVPVGKSVYEHGTEEMRDAAKKKMFGPLTRTIEVWRPNKLLCKRFNVPDPDISEMEMVLARKKKNKYSVFDYYEAYQQNKEIKEGPEPKKVEEKPEDVPPVAEEINPALTKYISFETSNEKIISDPPESQTCTSNIDIISNKILTLPSTSSTIPSTDLTKPNITETPKQILHLPQSSSKSQEVKKLIPKIPTDPKQKRDLFQSIFLSSSDESEDEKEKEPQQKIKEMAKILLEEPEKPSGPPNPKPNKGIFADMDWTKVNRNKQIENSKHLEDIKEKKDSNDDNTFGPKLPAQIPKQATNPSPWKPVFTSKKSVEISSSSDDEWMELDSSVEKISKKKHKKHKSKHKKHKSKHKKKKRSDRH